MDEGNEYNRWLKGGKNMGKKKIVHVGGIHIVVERKNEEITNMLLRTMAKNYQVDIVEYDSLLREEIILRYAKKGRNNWQDDRQDDRQDDKSEV